MAVDDLVAFLTARLDEDEAAAAPGRRALDNLRFELKEGDPYEQHLASRIENGLDIQAMAWHARVLREVAAKRAILALHAPEPGQHPDFCGHDLRELPCPTLRLLAAVYSGHPGYRQEWAPAAS